MKITLAEHEIARRLVADKNANWSREGAEALAEYLCEHYPNEEFDLVGIRCEYTELDSEEEAFEEFGSEVPIVAHLSNGGVIVIVI